MALSIMARCSAAFGYNAAMSCLLQRYCMMAQLSHMPPFGNSFVTSIGVMCAGFFSRYSGVRVLPQTSSSVNSRLAARTNTRTAMLFTLGFSTFSFMGSSLLQCRPWRKALNTRRPRSSTTLGGRWQYRQKRGTGNRWKSRGKILGGGAAGRHAHRAPPDGAETQRYAGVQATITVGHRQAPRGPGGTGRILPANPGGR